MILVFIVVIIISILIVLVTTMFLELEISNFKFYKEKGKKMVIDKNYKAVVYFNILKHIKILKLNIDTKKIKSHYNKRKEDKNISFSLLKSVFLENLKLNNEKKIEFRQLNLDLKVGTENVMLTSGTVAIFNIIFPIILSKYIKKFDKKLFHYRIVPLYYNKNVLNISLECKTKIKLIHIVRIIRKNLNKKM